MRDRDTFEPVPTLESGDRLTRAEFEQRYTAMPELKQAELIEGVVYMPSRVRLRRHGRPHAQVVGWLMTWTSPQSWFRRCESGSSMLAQAYCPSNSSVRLTNAEAAATASGGESLRRWASSNLRTCSASSWPVLT